MYKLVMIFFIFLLISCKSETNSNIEFIKKIISRKAWQKEAEKKAIELIYDISQNRSYGILYNGKLVAENPFTFVSPCEKESLDKQHLFHFIKNENEINFMESQLSSKPYHWKQGQLKNKIIIPKKILKLYNYDNDTIFWNEIKKQYKDSSIYIVHFPIFTSDFQYAILTKEHISFWGYDTNHHTSFNGCSTILCEKEKGKWIKIDYINSAVQ